MYDSVVWTTGKCVALMAVVFADGGSSARMTHFGQEWVFSPHGKMSGEPLQQAFVILSTRLFENNTMFTLFSNAYIVVC